MNSVMRGVGRMLLGLLVLCLVAWAIVAVLRWRAIDDADRAALALMDVPAPVLEGRNGFAALMLADFDVPAAERDAALAADVARFERWQAEIADSGSLWDASSEGAGLMASFQPFADATWPRRSPAPENDAPLCSLRIAGCLAQVQAAPEPVRALLQEHAARLADLEDALAADHLYNTYPETISTPLPAMAAMRLPLTAAALDAVDGHVPEAYSRSCRLLAGARRMDRESGNLIEKFVAQALGEGAAHLLLELRRAHPLASLPDDCAPALAAITTDEAAICAGLRGEFRMQRALDRQLGARMQGWRPDNVATRALLYDSGLQATWAAGSFAPYCTEEARAMADAGNAPSPPVGNDDVECYAAYVSCTLMQMAMPSYDGYATRSLDHAAVLRLLFAAQAVADGSVDAQTAALAAGNAGYPVTFDATTQVATITLQRPRGDEAPTFAVDFSGLAPVAPDETYARLDGNDRE